jgi:NDP-sugar pyrophosphorylase family protein
MVFQAMDKLRAAGTRRFIINTHHCPEAWTAAFPDGKYGEAEVKLVYEPVILETGGGLANIASLLGDLDTELVIWNGDILSDCDMAAAFAHHRDNGGEATLVVREQGPIVAEMIPAAARVREDGVELGRGEKVDHPLGQCLGRSGFAIVRME